MVQIPAFALVLPDEPVEERMSVAADLVANPVTNSEEVNSVAYSAVNSAANSAVNSAANHAVANPAVANPAASSAAEPLQNSHMNVAARL
jgi:hypothetical protein